MQIQNVNHALPVQVLQTGTANKHLFEQGSTLQAQIVSVENNVMTLQMPDGTQFKAENLSGTPLRVGDTIQLMITSTAGGKATGSVVAVNDQPLLPAVTDSQLQLTQIGQSANQDNVRLVGLFSKFNYPMTKASFDHLVKILEAFPQLPQELAVFMAANNIEATPQNVHSLQSIGNLHQEIQTIVDQINAVLTQLPLEQFAPQKGAAVADAPAPMQTAAPLLSGEQPAPADAPPTLSPGTLVQEPIDITGFLQQAVPSSAVEQRLPAVLSQAVPFVLSGLPENAQTPLVKSLLTAVVEGTVRQLTQGTPKAELTLPPQVEQLLAALPAQTFEGIMKLVPQMQALTNRFLTLYSVEDAKNALFAQVNEELSGSAIRQTLQSTPTRLLELGNLRLSDSWSQVANSVKLGDQSMTYMQIPLQIGNREQTGELYIFKRQGGKRKKDGEDSTKVVFALNTQHIGRFESVITANKMDLQLNIRLESQRIKDLVDGNLETLQRLLKQTKYNLVSLSTSTIQKPITVSNVHEVFGYRQLDIEI